MRHRSKYKIPDFQLYELVEEYYGYRMTPKPKNSYNCTCPMHNHDTPGPDGALRIYEYTGDESTPRHGGYVCPRGVKGNAWTFLSDVLGFPLPGDANFDETIEFICETLGKEPELKEDYEVTPADKAYDLMRDLKDALEPLYFEKENKHYSYSEEQDEWLYRGINPMMWHNYGVGMISEIKLQDIVATHPREAFRAAGLKSWGGDIGYRWIAHGVVLIRPSRSGAPLGLGVRRYEELCGSEPDPKYIKNNSNSQLLNTREYIFGLDSIRKSRREEIFVVEGEFDALALRVRGVPNVVTYGSGQPTDQQLNRLYDTGKHLVFVADSDGNQAGFNHVASIAEKAPDAQFVFLPGEQNDPDEFVQQEGIEAFLDLPRNTALQIQMLNEPQYSWENHYWTGNSDALVKNYMDYIIDQPSVFDEIDVEYIATLSGYDPEYLKSYLFRERNIDAAAEIDKPMMIS